MYGPLSYQSEDGFGFLPLPDEVSRPVADGFRPKLDWFCNSFTAGPHSQLPFRLLH